MAQDHDDGKRVGIRAFTIIDEVEHEHWMVRKLSEAVSLANTLHDFLNGQRVGKDYKWTGSRRYIFQDVEREDHEDTEGGRIGVTARVGIPYHNEDFIWDDGQRQPETKPADTSMEECFWATSPPYHGDNIPENEGTAMDYKYWADE